MQQRWILLNCQYYNNILSNQQIDIMGTGPDEFENTCLNIMLYHDATGPIFSVIEGQLKHYGTNYYGHFSMLHNSQVIQKALDGWANEKFVGGGSKR